MKNQRVQGSKVNIIRQDWQSPALPFLDPVCIAANSQGQLTPEQRQVLVKEKASQIRGIGLLLLIISCLLFIFSCEFPILLLLLLVGMGLGCVFIVLSSVRRKRFQKDLAEGRTVLSVTKLQGEIIWDQKRKDYRANLSNALSFPVSHCFPGPYSFYLVEEEAKIVSLMPLHTSVQREQALLMVQMALCDDLRFDLSDLDANQKGLLSEKQRHKIRRRHKRPLTIQSLEGEIFERSVYTPPNSHAYCYEIERVHFPVPVWNQLTGISALIHRMRYRVYYLAGHYHKLLSVEPLEVLETSV